MAIEFLRKPITPFFLLDNIKELLFIYNMEPQPEYFPYKCPHCGNVRNARDVAAELPDQVLRPAGARHNAGLRRTFAAGTGRPTTTRCPGCSQEMSYADLREHRIPCVRTELEKLRGRPVLLSPKDPDPYPNFHLLSVNDSEAEFEKSSNNSRVTVDLRKISEITISHDDKHGYVQLLGRIVWRDDIQRWRFVPTGAVGRPPRSAGD